jgi:hypothetical protein
VSSQKYQRHLLQLGYVDRLLGSVIDRLKARGLYDKSVLVVTADNGESFGRVDNGHEISRRNFGDIALTPLFVKRPYQAGGATPGRHVRTEDVVPTLARLTHTRIAYHASGHSIYGPAARKIPRRAVVYQRSGRSFALSAAGLRRWARGAQRLKAGLFGQGDEGPGLYGIGPYRGLVGRPLDDLHPGGAGNTRAILNGAGTYRAVRPAGSFVPAYVTGQITGAIPAAVAVAVNGKVAATSPVFRTVPGGPFYYAAMAPPSSFRAGANDVRLLGVSGSASAPRVSALR